MKLEEISIKNYRNIREINFLPCPGINVIYGDNAQGKTNLMEAIWLFTGNSSFRGAKTNELPLFGSEQTNLEIRFSDRKREQKAEIMLGNRKRSRLNGVELKTAGELNGNFYAVVFSPSDLSFIHEGPKGRRRFLDVAIAEIKPQYKSYLLTYEKLVEQRNALLRGAAFYPNMEENIDVWDFQLAKVGTILSIYRGEYVRKLQVLAQKIYDGLSFEKEYFDCCYSSTVFDDINRITSYEDIFVNQYYQCLKESYSADLKQGFTGVGIHRDDLELAIDKKLVRIYGSQGQRRSSIIALKLAEASLLKKATGESPVMLLDDVMSELDVSRQGYILNHLQDMQVFITCCDVSNTMKLKNGKILRIENGMIAGEDIIQ